MDYSLERVDTVAVCDMLLISAHKKKQSLERKRRNLGETIETFRKRMDGVGQDSALVQSMLLIYTAAHEALPAGGKDKINMNIEVKRLELRQAQLEKRALTYNLHGLLSKQVKYNMLDNQIAEIDSYISAVENRKTALANTALRVTYTATAVQGSISQAPWRLNRHDAQAHFTKQSVVHLKQEAENRVYLDQYRPRMFNTGQG